jgi:hypothetical protein
VRAGPPQRLSRVVTLDDEDIEAVAARVVELLNDQPGTASRLVDATTLARALGVDRDWVYARARELGAVRLGAGPKARLRFDVARARAALAVQDGEDPGSPGQAAEPARAPSRAARAGGCAAHPGEGWPVRAMLRPFAHDGPAGAPTPPDPAPEEYSDAGLRLSKRAPLMARPRSGTLKRRPTNRGLSFGVAFRYRGARYYEHFGGEWEGWTE